MARTKQNSIGKGTNRKPVKSGLTELKKYRRRVAGAGIANVNSTGKTNGKRL